MKRLLAMTWFISACLAVCGIGSPSSAQVNLLANPGFDDGGGSYNGWFTFGGGPQISLEIRRSGAAASKIYGEFTGCPDNPQFDVGGYGQAFTPTPGKVYELNGWSYVASGDPIPGTDTCEKNRLLAKIVFFDAPSGGNELASNEVVIGDGNSPTDQWMSFSVSAPAPASAQRVEALFLFLQPACDPGSVFVDDTSFYERSPVDESNLLSNASFTFGLTEWTTFGNVYPDSRVFAVRTPPGSAKMYSTFEPDSPSGIVQSFAAEPGSDWKLDVHSLTTCIENPIDGSNDNYAVAKIVFRDSNNNELGAAETVIMDNLAPLGTWKRHSVVLLDAPTGTATVEAFVLFISPTLMGGAMWIDDLVFQELTLVGVSDPPSSAAFHLRQNSPNPFSRSTQIDFELAQPAGVNLGIFDLAGRRVATLFQGRLDPGVHSMVWDGRLNNGATAAAGVYRYVLETPTGSTSRSLILLR